MPRSTFPKIFVDEMIFSWRICRKCIELRSVRTFVFVYSPFWLKFGSIQVFLCVNCLELYIEWNGMTTLMTFYWDCMPNLIWFWHYCYLIHCTPIDSSTLSLSHRVQFHINPFSSLSYFYFELSIFWLPNVGFCLCDAEQKELRTTHHDTRYKYKIISIPKKLIGQAKEKS